jgi:hypothetical protein
LRYFLGGAKKGPIIWFAADKKIISWTFKIRIKTLVFSSQIEKERENESSASKREKEKERTKVRAIIFVNRPG